MVSLFYNSSKGLNNAKTLTKKYEAKYTKKMNKKNAFCTQKKSTNNKNKCLSKRNNYFKSIFPNKYKYIINERNDKLNKSFIFYKDKVFTKIDNLCNRGGIFSKKINAEDITKLLNYIEKLINVNDYKIKIKNCKERNFSIETIFKNFKPDTRGIASNILFKKDVKTYKQDAIKQILIELKSIIERLLCKG